MKKISVAIIGLGRIGQGYDYEYRDDSLILTHATGFFYHPGYNLLGAVDPDPIQRKRFEAKFKKPAFSDVEALFSQCSPDAVSIGTPANLHLSILRQVIKHNLKAVLCEKPLSLSLNDAKKMVSLADKHQCALLVNYIRRFDPGMLSLRTKVQQGGLGNIYKGTVWYSKGLLNNGSHLIDLLLFLLGKATKIKVVDKGRKWNNIDPEPDVIMCFGKASIYFLSAKEECYSLIQMELVGTGGLIRYAWDGKIEVRKAQPDPVYPEYTVLGEPYAIPNDFLRYQWYSLENLYHHLMNNHPLYSDGNSAIQTLEVVDHVFRLMKK